MIYLEEYGLSILQTVIVPVLSLIIFSVLRHFYKAAQKAEQARRQFWIDFSELMEEKPADPPQEAPADPPQKEPEPPLEPGKVKCEYCDSYVPAGTNCPNCGAVLPAQDEVLYVADGQEFTLTVDEVPPFVQFCRIAHDLGSVVTAPPLTQRR